jgi:hypothetical protein
VTNTTSPGSGGSSGGGSGGGSDDPASWESDFDASNTLMLVTVSAPDVFRVGGTLREQTVQVLEVALLCDGRLCAGAAEPTVERFVASLSLVPSSAKYSVCPYTTSSGCSYYIATSSTPEVRVSRSSLTGGTLRAGFFSPTATGVYVRPTLRVRDSIVRFPGSTVYLDEVPVVVVFTNGEQPSGISSFAVNRPVSGSIGR